MAMDGYEPASGFNLPPGCSETDVDRAMGYGEAAPCGECAEAVDVCCDYCVCGRELAEWEASNPGASPREAVEWARDHLRDIQEDGCRGWI